MTDPHPPARAHEELPVFFPRWENIEVDGYDAETAVAAVYLAVLDHTSRLAGDLERGQLRHAYVNAAMLRAAAADLVARLEQYHARPEADGDIVWHDDGLDADRIRILASRHSQKYPIGRTLHPRTTTPEASAEDRA